MKKETSEWASILEIMCGIVMVSLSQVNGASMIPNFDNGEILLYNRLDRNIQYGNVIIFQKHNKKYVKGVFGKPGDTVAVSGDGVYILRIKNNEPFSNYMYLQLYR